MPVYEYKAVSATGKSLKGVVEAANTSEARAKLRREGTFLTEIRETQSAVAQSQSSRSLAFWNKASSQDISLMTRQLSTLIESGIPLVESLIALVAQSENVQLKSALADVKEKVNEGANLADAMKAHPKIFSNLYVNMIRAGEASGQLETVLDRLADFYENQSHIRSKVTSALAYPAVMLLIGFVALLAIFTFVIPKITKLYNDLGQSLPLPTQILIGISKFFTSYWYIAFALIALIVWATRKYIRTPKGQRKYHRFLLTMPVFGKLFQMVAIGRFANTLATLLSSGVPILMAMDIVKNVVDNVILTEVLEKVRVNLREGDSISEPLRRSGEFPPLVTHMIAIGEKTGELDTMLEKVSETYSNQVDARVSMLTSLLEPFMIVLMAVVIGSIVLSVMLPIFQMNSAIG